LVFLQVALRLKKQVSEVPASATIKSVVGGKSTMQNELIGDIQAEFGDGFKVLINGSRMLYRYWLVRQRIQLRGSTRGSRPTKLPNSRSRALPAQ
jgi:hypothetical protein